MVVVLLLLASVMMMMISILCSGCVMGLKRKMRSQSQSRTKRSFVGVGRL